MSQENVEIVRSHLKPHDGEDIIPAVREYVERLGPTPDADAVLAVWAEDEGWRHFHPEGEWEVANSGVLDIKAVGPVEIARWWNDWVETWEQYTYRVVEYRDLGEWVLTVADVQARGRGGILVEMRTFEIRQVRGGRVGVCPFCAADQGALEAAGLSEWGMAEENVEIVRPMPGAFTRGDVHAVIAAFDEHCELSEPPEVPDRPAR